MKIGEKVKKLKKLEGLIQFMSERACRQLKWGRALR